VVVTDLNEEAARAVAEECGSGAVAHALDVRDANGVRERIEATAREHGRIDYLFNNAGIGIGGEVQDLANAHWDRIIDINIRGVVYGVSAAYPIMVKQGSGHIVNTASLAGLGPVPLLTPYALTKHAVVGLSTSLRIEAAALGVRVSALCPAAIETPLLDSDNPVDLPKASWRPDIRGFLTQLAGPPYPVEACAEEALRGVERNLGLIVLPARGRVLWRVGRFAPWLVERVAGDAVAAARAARG
jgi:NAD(P)-dependent dehydrogenase (short-subunit alcohol dehydrogenase family)